MRGARVLTVVGPGGNEIKKGWSRFFDAALFLLFLDALGSAKESGNHSLPVSLPFHTMKVCDWEGRGGSHPQKSAPRGSERVYGRSFLIISTGGFTSCHRRRHPLVAVSLNHSERPIVEAGGHLAAAAAAGIG